MVIHCPILCIVVLRESLHMFRQSNSDLWNLASMLQV